MFESLAAFVAFAAFAPPNPPPLPPPEALAPPGEPKVIHVRAGLLWNVIAREANPGDVIALEVGIHIGGRIEDLHGTRDRPITIRGVSSEKPSAIKCEEIGIELVRCSWIRVENLYFTNPRVAAIVIDGTVPAPAGARSAPDPSAAPTDPAAPAAAEADTSSDVSIAIAACHIATERPSPGLDAVRVINARNVGIADCRFDAWSDAAVDLRGSSAVMITRSRFIPNQPWHHPFAIRAGSGCTSIVALQNVFSGDIGTGVGIGACEPNGDSPPAANVGAVQVARSAFTGVHTPISVAGTAVGVMDHCTVIDPKFLYSLDARCGAPRLTIANSLVRWEAGRLTAPSERRGDVTPEMVELGENLWWSEELPMFFEAAGRPFGVERAPQVIDLDPILEGPSLRPAAPAAKRFGWAAPPPTPPGAAPSTGTPPSPPSSPAENPVPRE